jgi:mannose-6-phosphate isomerase-like protein (cupin superfamily)
MDWEAEATEIRKERGLGEYQPLRPFVAKRTLERSLWYEGQLLVMYAHAEEVGHTCCVWEGNCPEGMGPPPHIHLYEHELFFIIEGHLTAWVEGVEFDVPKDSLIFLPAGRTHWFVSAATVTRIFSFTVSAGKDFPSTNAQMKLFQSFSRPAEAMVLPPPPDPSQRPDREVIMKLAKEVGFAMPQVEREGWRRGFGNQGGDGNERG